jgi:small subunit ribosomal protein S18
MVKKKDFVKKKMCAFCIEKVDTIDYKNPSRLKKFMTEKGKMLPRRVSGNCAKHQRSLSLQIKRARHLALLPYVVK